MTKPKQHSKPTISLIVAMDNNRLIGVENKLPWKLPADMKWFVANTKNKAIIVGRKTYESFGGKPLKDRTNIVISRDPNYRGNGAIVVNSPALAVHEAVKSNQSRSTNEVMIIGGASFYKHYLPLSDKLYLTTVKAEFKGDAWFPKVDMQQWQEVSSEHFTADEKNSHDYSFYTYKRIHK